MEKIKESHATLCLGVNTVFLEIKTGMKSLAILPVSSYIWCAFIRVNTICT